MATNEIVKESHWLKSREFRIFHCQGFVENGKWLSLNVKGDYVVIPPFSASQEIGDLITCDLLLRSDRRINYIQICPEVALILFFEGNINRLIIERSEVWKGKIIFNDVKFKFISSSDFKVTSGYKVVVAQNLEYDIATYTPDDEIV